MALDDSDEDRTEAPTQYRREEFRKQGVVALSREVISIVLLCALGFTLSGSMQTIGREFHALCESFMRFGKVEEMTKAALIEIIIISLKSWAWMVVPLFTVGMITAIGVCVAQVGFQISTEPLSPKWDRLDPVKGMQRLFSSQGIAEASKAVVKLAVASIVIWYHLQAKAPEVAHIFEKDTLEICKFFGAEAAKLFFLLIGILSALAAADYGFQKFRVEKQMRMSRREVRDEFKLREGDPLIRSRIRAVQRKIANQRMMEAIPEADVVVTNPTHISVALKYDAEKMPVPKVVAKGADHIAFKIREVAKKNGVPLVENKPLARALFKEVDIGHYVPRDLYRAVAQVLAYVYRLKNPDWNRPQPSA